MVFALWHDKNRALGVLRYGRVARIEYLDGAKHHGGPGLVGLFRRLGDVVNGEVGPPVRRDTLLLFFVSLLIHRGHFEATQFLNMVVHSRTHLLKVVYPAEPSAVER